MLPAATMYRQVILSGLAGGACYIKHKDEDAGTVVKRSDRGLR